MNKYKRWHDQIIDRAKQRKLRKRGERHHIVPRCIGGSNDKSNIVKLTYREHFLVHWLLIKIVPEEHQSKMRVALWYMSHGNDFQRRKIGRMTGWRYELVKRMQRGPMPWITESNKRRTGKKRPPRTKEWSAAISAAKKGIKASAETKAKMSAVRKGKKKPPRTESHCAAISAARLKLNIKNSYLAELNKNRRGFVRITDGISNRFVDPGLQMPEGWWRGRVPKNNGAHL